MTVLRAQFFFCTALKMHSTPPTAASLNLSADLPFSHLRSHENHSTSNTSMASPISNDSCDDINADDIIAQLSSSFDKLQSNMAHNRAVFEQRMDGLLARIRNLEGTINRAISVLDGTVGGDEPQDEHQNQNIAAQHNNGVREQPQDIVMRPIEDEQIIIEVDKSKASNNDDAMYVASEPGNSDMPRKEHTLNALPNTL